MQHIGEIIKDVMDDITKECNNCNRRFHRSYLEIDIFDCYAICKDRDECNQYNDKHLN